jgi:hypothetical protein
MSIWIKFGFVCVRVKSIFVSSANNTDVHLLFTNWGKLFMYKINSKGPRMEPCGNPCLINVQLESVL